MLPTSADRAVISLPSTETVTVPSGFSTQVESFTSTAALNVAGSLTATGKSIVSGSLTVSGTLDIGLWMTSPPPPPGLPPSPPPPTSYPPGMVGPYPHSLPEMTELSGLIALGGGTISGTVQTVGPCTCRAAHFN